MNTLDSEKLAAATLVKQESSESEHRERPNYISYFDPIVEYYTKFHGAQEWLEKRK